MKKNLLPVAAVLLAVSLTHPVAAQSKKVVLQGKWQAISATSNGEAAPKGMLARLTMVFNKDTVSIMGARPTRFKVNTKAVPAHIDFLNSAGQVGIFKLDGNTLKICTGQKGDRPKVFATKKYSDHTYLLLKRVKN